MEMKEKAEIVDPLVSIIVITYNSAKYVLETLESAKAQTYQNIELIVSDDCSTDDTVEICRDWINENGERFVRTELITAEKNTGIAPNCNRGLFAAKGEWIKYIAGDDVLLSNCIIEFTNAIINNENIKIIFSDGFINGEEKTINTYRLEFYGMTASQQYIELLKKNILLAPASFINRYLATSLNGFNEDYPLFEDYPFFLKVLQNNNKIYHLNKKLVNYRVNYESISSTNIMNLNYYESVLNYFQRVHLKSLRNSGLIKFYCHYFIELILLKLVLMKIIKRKKTFYFLLKWISNLGWEQRIKKIIRQT